MIPLPVYSQRDPRWKDVKLGTQGRTIGSHGCLLTCLAMALPSMGYVDTPDQLLAKLDGYNGIALSGDLWWPSVEQAYPKLKFVYRWDTTNVNEPNHQRMTPKTAWLKAERLFQLGFPTPLFVGLNAEAGQGNHWVIYIGNGKIIDPWFGEIAQFSKRYGDPMLGLMGIGAVIGEPGDPIDGPAGQAIGYAIKVAKGINVQQNAKEVLNQLLAPDTDTLPEWIGGKTL